VATESSSLPSAWERWREVSEADRALARSWGILRPDDIDRAWAEIHGRRAVGEMHRLAAQIRAELRGDFVFGLGPFGTP
jgi:hypothetical protein